MLRGKIIKDQQRAMVFLQALSSFRILCFICVYKALKISFCFFAIFGLPNLMQVGFGFRLKALWKIVQYIGGLMNLASLAFGHRKYLGNCFPEAQCAVPDRKLRTIGKAPGFQVYKKLRP